MLTADYPPYPKIWLMNLPGNMANPPAMKAPIIVPVMNAACLRTFPRRIETTAITMQNIVQTVRI